MNQLFLLVTFYTVVNECIYSIQGCHVGHSLAARVCFVPIPQSLVQPLCDRSGFF